MFETLTPTLRIRGMSLIQPVHWLSARWPRDPWTTQIRTPTKPTTLVSRGYKIAKRFEVVRKDFPARQGNNHRTCSYRHSIDSGLWLRTRPVIIDAFLLTSRCVMWLLPANCLLSWFGLPVNVALESFTCLLLIWLSLLNFISLVIASLKFLWNPTIIILCMFVIQWRRNGWM